MVFGDGMSVRGYLQEVFCSYQGEGTHVGRRTVFVRTAGCSLRCRFCDTPDALVRTAQVEIDGPGGRRQVDNPVTAEMAAGWVDELDPSRQAWVSLTGGEPLEQVDFLAAVVPCLAGRPVYLETAGVHAREFERLRDAVQFVAFDLKLDSVAGEGDRRHEHAQFLDATRGIDRLAKIIIDDSIRWDEYGDLVDLVAQESVEIPLVLQPKTPRNGSPPKLARTLLDRAYDTARQRLREVRVIPQTHRFLEIP